MLTPILQSFGPLGSPPLVLLALLALVAFIVVARVVLAIAWRLVLIAVIVVATLWVLGALGFEFGILG